MKLLLEKGELMLPEDFQMEMEVCHPFFTETGMASIPANIPASPHNLALLGFPTRTTRSSLYMKSRKASLAAGIFNLNGSLLTDTASPAPGTITCSFLSSESSLYEECQDKKLADIFENMDPLIFGTDSLADVETELWNMFQGNASDSLKGLAAFPVFVKENEYGFHMINEVNPSEDAFVWEPRSLQDSSGNTLELPARYGLSAFIRLSHLLDLTFTLLGYDVAENDFRRKPFADIVVINNCADLCVRNTIEYKNMVPDMTVGELLIWLTDKFAAGVFFNKGTIRIKMMDGLLKEDPDLDITPYAQDEVSIKFQDPRSVALNCSTPLEGAAPAGEDDFVTFLKTFADAPKSVRNKQEIERPLLGFPTSFPTYLLYEGLIGKFIPGEDDGSYPRRAAVDFSILGSTAFPYDRQITKESETRSAADRYLPDQQCTNGILTYHMPYIGEPIHRNTSVSGEKPNTSQELGICWCIPDEMGRYIGTSQPYFSIGEWATDLDTGEKYFPLTPDGIYHMCWRRYNRLLLSGAPEISLTLTLPAPTICSIDISKPKYYKGQKIIITKLSYIIDGNKISDCKCTAITLPLYMEDIADMDIYDTSNLVWKRKVAPDSFYATDSLTDYTEEDMPDHSPSYYGERAKERERKGTRGRPGGGRASVLYWFEYFYAEFKN